MIKRIVIVQLLLCSIFQSTAQNTYFNNTYDVDTTPNSLSSIVKAPNDSSYIVTGGYSLYPDFGRKIYVSKLDKLGQTLWLKDYHFPNYIPFTGTTNSINNLSERSFIVAGSIRDTSGKSDAILYRFDNGGDTIFTKRFDFTEWDVFTSSFVIDSNQILLVGNTRNGSSYDILLLKVDSLGDIIWQKNHGTLAEWESANSVDYNGINILIGGNQSTSIGTESKIYLVKTDLAGNKMWSETFGQSYTAYGAAKICSDGNYLAFGGMRPDTATNIHSYLAKITPSKQKLWEKSYPFSLTQEDAVIDIICQTDGSIIATGQFWNTEIPSYYEAFMMKTNELGEVIWQRKVKGREEHTYVYDLEKAVIDGYVISGWVSADGVNTQDGWVVKLDSMGCEYDSCYVTSIKEQSSDKLNGLKVYPNPAHNRVTVELNELYPNQTIAIYNQLGTLINEVRVSTTTITFGIEKLPVGMYFIQVTRANEIIALQKLIISN